MDTFVHLYIHIYIYIHIFVPGTQIDWKFDLSFGSGFISVQPPSIPARFLVSSQGASARPGSEDERPRWMDRSIPGNPWFWFGFWFLESWRFFAKISTRKCKMLL